MPVEGLRSGAGLQVLFDNRMPILNPLKGSMLEFNMINYNRYLGSEYAFTAVSADVRSYVNTLKNQTLALRVMGSAQFGEDAIPMRALSRVGGHKFIRGYFKGTYQDRHMAAFEMEYRLPFWAEDSESRLWQVWKRLGMVAFLGGAQVFHTLPDFQLNQFNLAVGTGLRILFNPESRTNLRIDYAIGLRQGSDGPGKRQQGLYFYLGEAF
jgi:outer membrane protein assembly factor BamA